MLIDQARFPLIFMRAVVHSDIPATTQLNALLDKDDRFVLISDRPPGGEHDETPAERKERALFFKRNKDRLRKLCAGSIVIEGDNPTPMPIRLAAQTFGKAFGIGFFFVRDEAEAIEKATFLLVQAQRDNVS